jgi:ABC-type transport system involved in multi-copper enzyme maturation permease subunit
LALLIIALVLQVNGKLDDLVELEAKVEAGVQAEDGDLPTPFDYLEYEANRVQLNRLRSDLLYPAFIGYLSRLSIGLGWFLIVLLTAVIVGEDFARKTLRGVLTRGVSRPQFLLARCLALWTAAGVATVTLAVLAAAVGPFIHAQVTSDPINLRGFGTALLSALRAWLTYLPFIAAVSFWAVLGRSAGPALGVGLGLRFVEVFGSAMVPVMGATFIAGGAEVPTLIRWAGNLLSVMLGYNADVVLHWGPPAAIVNSITDTLVGTGEEIFMPTDPWRAMAFLTGYTAVSLAFSIWIMRRRDITYNA